MNILIKLTCLIGLVIAPILGGHTSEGHEMSNETELHFSDDTKMTKKVSVEMTVEGDQTIATVTTITTANGEETKDVKTFKGTEAEVKAEIAKMEGVEVVIDKVAKSDVSELQGAWLLDSDHSYVDFSIRHILAKSKGSFNVIEGVIDFTSENPTMNITIDVNSINTSKEKRDTHLKTDEYFDVAKYPTITFVSKSMAKTMDGIMVVGDLTIKDVTKEVILPLTYVGKQDTPWGFPSAAFEGGVTIDRSEFHVGEKGGMLGDEVTIDFSFELNPKK